MKKHFIDSFDDVSVFTLTNSETGEHDGKILVRWSKSGGATCGIISNQLGINFAKLGKATGYGYCKLSASICDCLINNGFKDANFSGVGESAVIEWFTSKNIKAVRLV